MAKTMKRCKRNASIYNQAEYNSGDGMLTSVWGPGMWHFLHTMSFNYPTNPTMAEKQYYKNFMLSMVHILPCKFCRQNLVRNFKELPITSNVLKDRTSFSKYVYDLHEVVNRILKKKSHLTYKQVRERYEHFRARCTADIVKHKITQKSLKKKTEKGCTEPLYGKKSKCIIKIVPQEQVADTFQIDNRCIKRKIQ